MGRCMRNTNSKGIESLVELKTRRFGNKSSSDRVFAACWSRVGSSELAKRNLKSVDLELETQEKDENVQCSAVSAGDSLGFIRDSFPLRRRRVGKKSPIFRRETTPTAEESGELESMAIPKQKTISRRSSKAAKMPSEAELEEFFAAAEENLHKKFTEKYNYDIVKDEPLEGRFEWVESQ